MGEILSLHNLESYRTGKNQPGWPIPELLYQKIPVLAYRNYFCNDDKGWPLSWDKGRVEVALTLTVSILKAWQAFRPVGSPQILERLATTCPAVVMDLQEHLQNCEISNLDSSSNECSHIIIAMSCAASRVSEAKPIKSPNPMLGSKVLAFFFPDFFPVWDTAWIKRRALSGLQSEALPPAVGRELKQDPAASEYARYLWLMINDAWLTSHRDYEQLRSNCLRECRRKGYYKPEEVLEEFYADLTPLLFEVCLLGRNG